MHNYEVVEADDVKTLVADGETFTVEFKRARRTNDLNDEGLVEVVACMANGRGGTLLLGVEDDGQITGTRPWHGSTTIAHRLASMILNKTEPAVPVTVEVVEVDEKDVVVVEIPDMRTPVGTKSGKYLRRATRTDGKPQCLPYPFHEMLSVGLAAAGRDYASTPLDGVSMDDLDPREIDRFRSLCAAGKGERALADLSDDEILRALRLVRPELDDRLTVGAILLFGAEQALERFAPNAEALFQAWDGRAITKNVTIRQPLFAMAQTLYDLVDVLNSEDEVVVGLHRIEVPRIPASVLRESIANALVHRDYAERGPVHVRFEKDVLRVSSPGGFPPGITMENLIESSRPRSEVLSEAFKRAGIVDRAGRGIAQMFQSQLRAGRGEPDYATSNDRTVAVTIPTSEADLDIVRFIVDFEDAEHDVLNLTQLRIIYELKSLGPAALSELAQTLRLTQHQLRANVVALVERGIVEARGATSSRRFHLSAAFYRGARSSDYVRLQDTDPIQQNHMVLAYVDQFGSITRGKTAELCRLSPVQARAVLKKLVEAGELRIVGERRGARYVRP